MKSGAVRQLGLAALVIILPVFWSEPTAAEETDLERAEALNRQVVALYREHRYDDAIAPAHAALSMREKALGPEHPQVAVAVNTLAVLYDAQGRYADAEALYRRALAIREKALGPDHPDIAYSLNNLASVCVSQGRYADAEPLFKRSLALLEQAFGPESGDVATALANLGLLYSNLGRYAEAEPLYRRAVAVHEKILGPEHPNLAVDLNNLGSLYVAQARYGAAEPAYKRSLAILERALGPDDPKVANALSNLAHLYSEQTRYGEAEELYRRSLDIREKAFGPEHPDVALSLNNLAELYRAEGRHREAEGLFQRSLGLRETLLGAEHPFVALTLNNLAALYDDQGRYEEAETLYKRSLAIREKTLGPDDPNVARGLSNLGSVYENQKRYAEAEQLYHRSLAVLENALGPEHPATAVALNNLASAEAKQGRYAEAEPLYRRSVAITENSLGPEHRDVAGGLFNLAFVLREQGRFDEAHELSGRAVDIVAKRLSRVGSERKAGEANEQRRFRDLFLLHIGLAVEQAKTADEVTPETFRVAQLAKASSAGRALAGMAARFATGDDALAAVIREQQDMAQRWQLLGATLVQAAGKPPAQRDAAAEAALRGQFAETGASLDALEARIAREFPGYAALSNPKPLQLAEAQALLAADEAMLVYLVGPNYSWMWLLRRDRAALHRLEIGQEALVREVSALRERLDPDRNPGLAPFPANRAHALYRRIVAPAAALLDGARHVLIVPDGALESLPPGVLVARAPLADPETLAEHRDLAWFARDYALTVLPSVSALRGLRQFASASHAGKPFAGIGNPVLDGSPEPTRGLKPGRVFRGPGADVEAVRALPPLPETADELRVIAKALGGSDQDLFLAERAAEPVLRSAPLDQYRVVEFATHGLVSGDLPGLAEPALVLTPPKEASPDNDGLLTVSEVATLKLNADWVVLSACNTAAGDGTPDAGGLSGLAKAFFYAGARSLLVSHWSVPSRTTVQLVTKAFAALNDEPAIGRAEALRRAEMAMLDPKNPPEFAHPLAWAPFVLVGEGGAGR